MRKLRAVKPGSHGNEVQAWICRWLLARGPSLEVAMRGEPEVSRLTFGILPLTDCAPIVVAHEKAFFEKQGIESSVMKFGSWTASRDGLLSGKAQAAHMLFGMPVAAAVGKLGTEHRPLVIPWILNRNGQAITVSVRHRELLGSSARDLRAFAQERRDKGRPMVFAMTLQPGTHAMWLRYWLAAGGIHPDNDVALITIPPPMMVANMRAGRLDGFCVGEPWNVRAIEEELGFTAILSEEIWPDHPEKVLAFTEEFAEAHPNSVKAALKALHEATVWCDEEANRDELAIILAQSQYINCAPGTIRSRLGSSIDCGDGRTARRPARSDLLRSGMQLSTAEVRGVVALAIPTLDDASLCSRLPRRRRAGHAARLLRSCDERTRRAAWQSGIQLRDPLRRKGFRPRRT